jgi:hypothetical protein
MNLFQLLETEIVFIVVRTHFIYVRTAEANAPAAELPGYKDMDFIRPLFLHGV